MHLRRPLLAWALILGGCATTPVEHRDVSGIVEARLAQVGPRAPGRVARVVVEEGQMVEAGALLVELEARELLAERKQLAASQAQAEAQLRRLEHGFRPEEIRQAEANQRREAAQLEELRAGPRTEEIRRAEADLAAARAEANNAAVNWERTRKLFETGDVPQQTFDNSTARRDTTAKQMEAARERLALLQAGTRPEQIAAGEARLAQAKASLDLLRAGYRKEEVEDARARVAEAVALLQVNAERLAEMEVRAPGKARVETVSVRPGDVVAANRVVATLFEPGQLWVRAYVPEPKLGSVRLGQRAAVSIDTFPGKAFAGEVVQIATQAEFLPRNIQTRDDREHQVFAIRIRPGPDGLAAMKPGMAATVVLE